MMTKMEVMEKYILDQNKKWYKLIEYIRLRVTETKTFEDRQTLYEILLAGDALYDNGDHIDQIISTQCTFNYSEGIIRLNGFTDEEMQIMGTSTIKSDSVRDKVFRELTEKQKLNMNGKIIWIVVARCETSTNRKTWRCIDHTHTRRMSHEA